MEYIAYGQPYAKRRSGGHSPRKRRVRSIGFRYRGRGALGTRSGDAKIISANGFCGLKSEAAGEHGEPSKEHALGWRQQVVAPFHGCPQSLLPGPSGTTPPSEQSESVV